MLRRSKRKRDTTGVSSEIGSLNPAADDELIALIKATLHEIANDDDSDDSED